MERLINYFVPERYELELKFDTEGMKFSGVATICGEVKNDIVKFHAVNMKIEKVFFDDEPVEFEYKDDLIIVKSMISGGRSMISESRSMNKKHTFKIFYEAKINENMEGVYLSTYEYKGKTEKIIATQFESHYAREAFPCIDEPEAKAVFELAISIPEELNYTVLSNMTEMVGGDSRAFATTGANDEASPVTTGASEEAREASSTISVYKTVYFEPTPRMSTYLLAFVIGKFHGKTIRNEHGVEITTYAPLNQDIDSVDYANEIAGKSLEFYDDNFGEPYPLKKLDQVALPDFEAGAMENWGLVTYRESMLLVGKTATLGTKKSVALTVAHELSHQWFGDLVTMKWWDDLWLNESFASVMEYYAVDYIHPEYQIFEGFFTGDSYLALMRDAYEDVQSVHQEVKDPAEIATLFDSAIVYSKGARLMLMLIRAMGWKKFCRGVSDYFKKFKYGNTVGDDLWEALNRYADFDVKALMHDYIDKPGYPVILEDGSQKRFLMDGELQEGEWPIPKVTEDMSGHYIINLTEDEFKKRLSKFDKLSLEEKIRLLIDRNLVTKTKLADSATLLPLVQKFKNENSASVWGIVLSIISGLKIFFEPDSEEEGRFKKFVEELISPKLKEIGLVTRKNDNENTIRLRAILLGLNYYTGNEKNLKKLAEKYDENYQKIDAEVRENVFEAKLYFEPELVNKYIETYKETADPELKFELLFSGTISKNEKVLARMMKLLDQPDIVKPQDQLYLFVYLYRNSKTRKKAYEWLVKHWDYVKGMAGDKSLENYPRYMANVIRTEIEYMEWKEFFGPKAKESALARAVKIGEKEIKARLKLIAEDKVGVYEAVKAVI